jgi:predicted ATPase
MTSLNNSTKLGSVRIASLKIRNYRGIALAEASGLADQPVLMISGKNGTGKTMILEAVASAWQGRVRTLDAVGPWGDRASISVTVELEESEIAALTAWSPASIPTSIERNATYSIEIRKTEENWRETSSGPVMTTLRSSSFQRENPFAEIDFLSAHRQSTASDSASVDLGMFNRRRMQEQREQQIQQHVEFGHDMYLPDVGSYLLTLDYHGYLAERQELEPLEDFSMIADAFERATGKTILKPYFDAERGESGIEIRLPSGPQHSLSVLSSGEREMLALMYFVRRLSATGGILLLDEPEKHLHPSLQGAVLEIAHGMADRAQLIVVTHSVNMINAASPKQMLQMDPPSEAGANQLSRLTDNTQRLDLLGALGIVPADLSQSDCLIVVEGARDEQWLTALFPVEMSRAHILIAGSGKQVEAACSILSSVDSPLPWIAIRDRDLLTDAEVATRELNKPNLFIWRVREFENVLLHPALISQVLANIGITKSASELDNLLQSIAAALTEDVVESLTLARLTEVHPVNRPSSELGRFKRQELNLRATADAFAERAAALEDTVASVRVELDSVWEQQSLALVDGKAMIGAVRRELNVFGSYDEFVSALLAASKLTAHAQPSELQRLATSIAGLLARE